MSRGNKKQVVPTQKGSGRTLDKYKLPLINIEKFSKEEDVVMKIEDG